MAIQSSYNAVNHGLVATNAYTKIASFVVENIEPKHISIYTETYFDTDARTMCKTPIGYNSYQMDFVDNFTFADMYSFLKSQVEFTGAVDVI